jgi:hypothetical protein
MKTETGSEPGRNRVEIDENGVDRTAIREMLARSPVERLRWLEEFVNSVMIIRNLNGSAANR